MRETDDLEPSVRDRGSERGGDDLAVLAVGRGDRPPIFYYEPPKIGTRPSDRGESGIGSGLVARARRWLRGAEARLDGLERSSPSWARSALRWVRTRVPADERLLLALRTAEGVTLLHPASMPPDETRSAWERWVRRRLKRRAAALAINVAVLVPTTLLALVPGPNVVGYWFAYRAACNGLALFGVGRALRGRIETRCEEEPILDGPVSVDRDAARRVERHFGMIGLVRRLRRDRIVAKLRRRGKSLPGGVEP